MKAWWPRAFLLVAATLPACAPAVKIRVRARAAVETPKLQAGTGNQAARAGGDRACTDEELAEHALLLAFGPGTARGGLSLASLPSCVPAGEQGLWPLRKQLPRRLWGNSSVAQASKLDGALAGPISLGTARRAARRAAGSGDSANRNSSAESLSNISTPPEDAHLVHVLVVQSHEGWCKSPCNQPTWELQAPKPLNTSNYRLLEVAIWHQERKVTLYRFDPNFERRARNTYNEVCYGSWSCPYYNIMRESHKLLTVGPWPEGLAEQGLSTWLKDAFKKVFDKVLEAEPGSGFMKAPVALTYTGHGAMADGSLFEGSIYAPDAHELLGYVTGVGGVPGLSMGRLGVLNFGSNCEEGRWKMMDSLHPFADWITASDLKVGGFDLSNLSKDEMTAVTQAQEEFGDLQVIKDGAEAGISIPDILQNMVQARHLLWTGALAKPITDQQLRQTIAVFASDKYPPFAEFLREAYQALPDGDRAHFEQQVTAADCDVLVAVNHLEGADGDAVLQKSFLEMRPVFSSTKDLFHWNVDANGLGFNFLGWRGDGGCDFASALGNRGGE